MVFIPFDLLNRDKYIEFLESHDHLKNSKALNETKKALYKDRKLYEYNLAPAMPPTNKQLKKQIIPVSNSYDSNFALVLGEQLTDCGWTRGKSIQHLQHVQASLD